MNIDDKEIDKTTFQSAENNFINGKKDKAIQGFKKYLDQFPKGRYALDAHFYLAQMLYNKDQFDRAAPHYQFVVDQPKNNFTEESLSRSAEIFLKNDAYQKAIPLLERLEKSASFTQNVLFAQTNLMKAYYETRQYEKAITYGEEVLNLPSIDETIKSDAHVFIARSSMKLERKDKAREAYRKVEEFARGKRKAEALYFKAMFNNQDGDFKASNQVVQQITRDYSNYKEYSYKSLVLMADNFYNLDDSYQANYILENIIDKTADYPDVQESARELLQKIKKEAAKTNSSVEAEEAEKDTNKN